MKEETKKQLLEKGLTEEEIRILENSGTLTEETAQKALGNPFVMKVLKGLPSLKY